MRRITKKTITIEVASDITLAEIRKRLRNTPFLFLDGINFTITKASVKTSEQEKPV